MTRVDPELLLAQTAWLRRLAMQLVGDPHVVEDVVQDTWVAALEHPPSDAHGQRRLRGWLGRVARNAVRMRHRGERRRAARELAVARPEHVPSAAEIAEPIAAQQRLLKAVMSLSDADRQVVVLRFLEGLPPRAIARRLGCTSVAVRSRLSRALGVLRARLAPRATDGRSLALTLLPLLEGGWGTKGSLLHGSWMMKATSKAMVATLVVGVSAVSWLLWDRGGDPADPVAFPDSARTSTSMSEVATAGETAGGDVETAPAVSGASGVDRTEVPTAAAGVLTDTTLVVVARCIDPDGAPVAGVRLTAAHVAGRPGVLTDADGRLKLEVAWPAKLTEGNHHWLVLEASAAGFATVTRQERVQGKGLLEISLGDLLLVPGGALAGRVQDVDGSPVGRARVWAVQGLTPSKGITEERRLVYGRGFVGLGQGIWSWADTDAAGSYRFESLPAGSVSVVARKSGRLCAYTPPVLVVAGGEAQAPLLALGPVAPENRIVGWVRDAAGNGLPGAEVSVFANRGPRNINATTQTRAEGAAGAFAVVVLSGQKYTLEVQLRGRARRLVVVHDVAAGTRDFVVAFTAPRRFELVLTGPGGVSLKPTGAWAFDETGAYLDLGWEEGPNGERIPLVPNQRFTLEVRAAGYLGKEVGPFEPKDVPARIEVELERAGMVRGRVVARGQPVAGAKVHSHFVDPNQAFHRFAHKLYTRLEAAGAEVTTDETGHFELPVHREGRYVLHAEAAGWARGASRDLDLSPGTISPTIQLMLHPPAAVEGQVLVVPPDDAEGQVVAATSGDGHAAVCVTDAAGRYRFEGLAPGGWQVRRCRSEDQEWLRMARTWAERGIESLPVDVQLHAGRTAAYDVDLRGEYSKIVHGRLAIDAVAAGGWRVSLWSDGTYVSGRTDADGRFQLRGATADTTLYFFGRLPEGGQLKLRQRLALVDGPNAVNVTLKTGGLELVDLLASAPPPEEDRPEGYALVWPAKGDGPAATYRFDPGADGSHRIDALPVGRAELRRRENDRTDVENWKPIADVEIVAGERRGSPRSSGVRGGRTRASEWQLTLAREQIHGCRRGERGGGNARSFFGRAPTESAVAWRLRSRPATRDASLPSNLT